MGPPVEFEHLDMEGTGLLGASLSLGLGLGVLVAGPVVDRLPRRPVFCFATAMTGACLFTVCDFRYAARGATLAFPEVDRGMHLAWGVLPHLAREYGAPLTRRLTLGGGAIAVDELPMGSVALETPEGVDHAAETWATQLAAKPPLAVRAILSALRAVARGEPHNADRDVEAFAATTGSDDFREALMAWFARRPGVYEGR